MALKSDNQVAVGLDWLKWSVAIILLLAGLIGNHYYSEVSMPIRTLAWLAVLAIAAFVASKTQKGQWVVGFFRDSRVELRKVVWPSRDETMQTTLIVAVMVVVLALILWGMDAVLVSLIGWLTGQNG
ncbi:MAG: preprotein translocase subunit SecE [Gammaproteobacteria bacterium RIFCSPHIGHO2_12_FULL_43_28]|nr:MAG: preprotein translocase subunit SecE [Gammaproteobacteria bacterium RIFCSPHIGHO2_12_FULL_43_28]